MTIGRLTRRQRRPCHRQEKGVSLLEILVGIGIGVLIVLAAATSLIFIRLSAATAEEAWRLQQDASTAFRVMGWQLREAGAQPLVAAGTGGRVEFATGYSGFGTVVQPLSLSGTDDTAGAPDVMQTSLQNDPAADARDCLGLAPANSSADIRSRFSVDRPDLSCTGVSSTAAFVSGVEDMQVWYGETPMGSTGLQYRSTPVDWASVKAVMVCLRLSGERAGQVTAPTTGCRGESIPPDGYVRRSFTRVFHLRNAPA